MMRNWRAFWRAFWRFMPRVFQGFLLVMMTLPMRMFMHRTGGITHAAGISHQRMQPRCTRRKNQLPASQHQSKELCRTPTHRLSVQLHERNGMYVVLTDHMLTGLTSRSKLMRDEFGDFNPQIVFFQEAKANQSEVAGTLMPRARGNWCSVN